MSSLQHIDVTMSLKRPKKALKKHYEINSYDLCNIFLLRASKVSFTDHIYISHASFTMPFFLKSHTGLKWNDDFEAIYSFYREKMQTISNNN